jgi:serine/threonine-protein kinase
LGAPHTSSSAAPAGPPVRQGRSWWIRWLTRAAWVCVFTGLLGLVSAVSFYATMRLVFTGREVTVPDLAGMELEQARAAAAHAELYLQEDEGRYDDVTPEGRIRAQDPPAGATIKKNRKLKVSVSLGPMDVTVPDVRGQSARSARLALEHEGLRVGHVTRTWEPGMPEDVVMAQDPAPSGAPGTPRVPSARSDGAVDLLVSRGPRPVRVIMPDLTGRRASEVSDFARRARLRMGPIRREAGSAGQRGVVLKQHPAAGQPVGRNDIISLVLSE